MLGGSDFDRMKEQDKEILNSSIGTEYEQPLDIILGSKLICKGVDGVKLHFENMLLGKSFSIAITKDTPLDSDGFRTLLIPVTLGNWEYTAEYRGTVVKNTVKVTTVGNAYLVPYTIKGKLIFEASSVGNHIFTLPNIDSILVMACAGGGGGGGVKIANPKISGGGGGGEILYKYYAGLSGVLNMSLGSGGMHSTYSAGEASLTAGKNGNPTILTGAINITLKGGGGGIATNSIGSSFPAGGAPGGGGAGNGGNGCDGSTAFPNPTRGLDSVVNGITIGYGGGIGDRGSASVGMGGGGGGASLGRGGNGQRTATMGEKGGGGGGGAVIYTGGSAEFGTKGGDGYIAIYEGVEVK